MSPLGRPYHAFGGHPQDDTKLLQGSKWVKTQKKARKARSLFIGLGIMDHVNHVKNEKSEKNEKADGQHKKDKEREKEKEHGQPSNGAVSADEGELPRRASTALGMSVSGRPKSRKMASAADALQTTTCDTSDLHFFKDIPPFGCELQRKRIMFPKSALNESLKRLSMTKKGFTLMDNVEYDLDLAEVLPEIRLKELPKLKTNILSTMSFVNKAVTQLKKSTTAAKEAAASQSAPAAPSLGKRGSMLAAILATGNNGGQVDSQIAGDEGSRQAESIIANVSSQMQRVTGLTPTQWQRKKWKTVFRNVREQILNEAVTPEMIERPNLLQRDSFHGKSFKAAANVASANPAGPDSTGNGLLTRATSSLSMLPTVKRTNTALFRAPSQLRMNDGDGITRTESRFGSSFLTEAVVTSGDEEDFDDLSDHFDDGEETVVDLEKTFPRAKDIKEEMSRRRAMMPYEMQTYYVRARMGHELDELLQNRAAQREASRHSVSGLCSIIHEAEDHGRTYAAIRRLPMQKQPLWERVAAHEKQRNDRIDRVCTFWAKLCAWCEKARVPTIGKLCDVLIHMRNAFASTSSDAGLSQQGLSQHLNAQSQAGNQMLDIDRNLLYWTMDQYGVDLAGQREAIKLLHFVRKETGVNEWDLIVEMEKRGWRVPTELKTKKRQLKYSYSMANMQSYSSMSMGVGSMSMISDIEHDGAESSIANESLVNILKQKLGGDEA
jgi:hypothetical protein